MNRAQAKEENNPFGVLEFLHWNHGWNSYKYKSEEELRRAVSLMKEAGVGWVRQDFLWQDIEAQEGKFDFSRYDLLVGLLHENNIGILGILDYTAEWASPQKRWNVPSPDHQPFLKFIRAVASRYKGKVKYWEVWNEPDSHIYWEPQDGLAGYCVLLKDTYLALKEIDPQCQVLNGGLASGLASVNNLYDHGAKGYFDILNIHIFESPLHPGALSRVLAYPKLAYKVMQRNGDGDKKIWITEIGCPGVPPAANSKNWWLGENPDEQAQADWVEKVFTNVLKPGPVEKVFWAFLRDTNRHWDDGTDYLGLLRWDFSKKAAFNSYQKCVQAWVKERHPIRRRSQDKK